jgi:hypothetical protein
MIQKIFDSAFALYIVAVLGGAALMGGMIAISYISRFGLKFPG